MFGFKQKKIKFTEEKLVKIIDTIRSVEEELKKTSLQVEYMKLNNIENELIHSIIHK